MNDIALVSDFIFSLMATIGHLYITYLPLALVFSLVILKFVVDILHYIKIKFFV